MLFVFLVVLSDIVQSDNSLPIILFKEQVIFDKGVKVRFLHLHHIGDLKQTTTVRAMRTWKNKIYNWKKNSSACVF